MTVNPVTASLKPYPMEELARLRASLREQGKKIYDFGTGDPKIPLWEGINKALHSAVSDISQYPSIRGTSELAEAHAYYLKKRFNLELKDELAALPTRGSKEAVFHIALSVVGRLDRKTIVYPAPGYPVYYSSTIFAGGKPHPVQLNEKDDYLLKPWELPEAVQKDCAAIWVNYPHNPTGAVADDSYWKQLIDWAEENDSVILSDDCYVDIFDPRFESDTELQPKIPLQFRAKNTLSLLSLSKRSGMTGYRCGMITGDSDIIQSITRARANMGLGQPAFLQAAAAAAWRDFDHVAERRKLFWQRMKLVTNKLDDLGLLPHKPKATFYIWADISGLSLSDVEFARGVAEHGLILTPGQWLGYDKSDRVRLALVPDLEDSKKAMNILEDFVKERR